MRLGEHNWENQDEPQAHVDFAIRKKIVHESFESYEHLYGRNDIALLELAEPVVFRDHVAPICLPKADADFEGRVATVSGWGRVNSTQLLPTSLQRTAITITNKESCRNWLAQNEPEIKFSEDWLCAGFVSGGKTPCNGDSGSGLFLKRDGRAQLVGIASWLLECGDSFKPHVYTGISHFVDWINTNMETNEVES